MKKCKKKERTRVNFYKDPLKFLKSLFTKEKNGNFSKAELVKYLEMSCTDNQRYEEITLPPDMPPIHPPEHRLDVSPPRWSEVEKSVHNYNNFLCTALNFFRVLVTLTSLAKVYFRDMQLCLTTADYTTVWQHLEVGIVADCTISLLAFTMAMEVINMASW